MYFKEILNRTNLNNIVAYLLTGCETGQTPPETTYYERIKTASP